MSKASRVLDAERTAIMLDLLHRRFEVSEASRAYVVLEEVAPGTGWYGGQRWADVLVLSVWPSNGLTLDGYEIKASRADLKKELASPSKHQALARYCNTWTLLAWDESILVGGIPETWGIDLTTEQDGCRELREHRRAPKLAPEEWPRSFVCSLVRNAFEQSPGAAFVARAVMEAHQRATRKYRDAIRADQHRLVSPLVRAIYGNDAWRHSGRDAEEIITLAVERLTQPLLSAGGGA